MNIIHILSGKTWGDPAKIAKGLLHAFRADSHQAWAVTRGYEDVAGQFEREGLLAARMAMRGFKGTFAPVRLASVLNRLEGDTVIHTYSFNDASIAVLARKIAKNPENIRVVTSTCHTAPPDPPASLRKIYGDVDRIIFGSDRAFSSFSGLSPLIDSQKLHNVRFATVAEPYKGPGEPSGRLIFSGEITPDSGLDTLIAALGQMKDIEWTLTVCGEGRGRTVMPIVRAARSLGIYDRISWKGNVEDTLPLLREASVAVFPAHSDHTYGIAVAEAASQGCAIVASDAVNLKNKDAALNAETGNPSKLADTLRTLICSPGMQRELFRKASEASVPYPTFYNSISDIYKQLFR